MSSFLFPGFLCNIHSFHGQPLRPKVLPSLSPGNPLATCPNTVSPHVEVQINNNGLELDIHCVSGGSLITHPSYKKPEPYGKVIEKGMVHMTSGHINAHGAAHSKYTDDSQDIEEGKGATHQEGKCRAWVWVCGERTAAAVWDEE